jgi:hypothetical protein
MKQQVRFGDKWYDGIVVDEQFAIVFIPLIVRDHRDPIWSYHHCSFGENYAVVKGYDEKRITIGDVDMLGNTIFDGSILRHHLTGQTIQVSITPVTKNSLFIDSSNYKDYEVVQEG